MLERTASQGFRNAFTNKVRVEEVLVGLPGLLAKTVELGELLDGDGVRHLQAEQEVVRRLVDHAFEILLAGKGVVGGVDADGLEDLGVFSEAVTLEPGFGELAPVFVAGAVVEHPAPAGVFPRRRANVNALHRQ